MTNKTITINFDSELLDIIRADNIEDITQGITVHLYEYLNFILLRKQYDPNIKDLKNTEIIQRNCLEYTDDGIKHYKLKIEGENEN